MNERYPLPEQNSRKMIRDSRALWEEIFSEDSEAFLNYYTENVAQKNRIQTRYEEGCLASMVHWNPYMMHFAGRTVKSYYLVGVATKERFRHRKYITGLISDGLYRLYAEKVPFVFLMPADPAIYTPLGFRYIYEKSEWEGSLATGGFADDMIISSMSVRALNESEFAEAVAWVSRRLRPKYSLFVKREEEYYSRMMKECESEGGAACGIFLREKMIGVFLWWMDDGITIRELVLLDEWENKQELLFRALLRYFDGSDRVRIVTTGWLGRKKPIIMARIVNLPRFLSYFTAPERVTVRIWVKDNVMPDNNGSFCWIASPEGSVVYATDKEADGAVNIDELLLWLFGVTDMPSMLPEECRKIKTISGIYIPEIV